MGNDRSTRGTRTRFALILSITALILALPAAAAAQSIDARDGQYDPRSEQVGDTVGGGDPNSASASASNSSLPFTGLDTIVLLSVGGALLAGGLAIRLIARTD